MMEFALFHGIFVVLFSTSSAKIYQNKLVVDCLNKPGNTGRYLVFTLTLPEVGVHNQYEEHVNQVLYRYTI